MRRLRMSAFSVCLGIFAVMGAGLSPSHAQEQPAAEQPAAQPSEQSAEQSAEQPELNTPVVPSPSGIQLKEPEGFVYNGEGLRDPFQPFIKIEPKKKKAEKPKVFVPKTPLQRYAVEELQLVGIVWAEGARARALIEDPEGKGYIVGPGTLVGDKGGKIVRIQPERVLVEERFINLLGEETVNTVTMTLRKPEGEVTP